MPRESHAWSVAREHLSPFGTLHRIENPLEIGFPDALYCLLGVTGLLEAKATAETLKVEQVMFAERWERAGGLCHTLLYADRTWFLFDAAGTRRLYERREPRPVVRAEGTFPLKAMLRALAPHELRRGATLLTAAT